MLRQTVTALLLCQLIILPSHCNEDNPLLDIVSSLVQNMGEGNDGNGMAAIGNLLGSLMQGDNAKNLGSMLGQNGNNAGDILSGLGSLLGGDGQQPKIDPALIGSMISMFAQNMAGKPQQENPQQENPQRENPQRENPQRENPQRENPQRENPQRENPQRENPQREKREVSNDFNLDSMLNLASGLMGNKDAAGFLPIIINALSSLSNTEAEKRAEEHKDHASFLPPILEKIHLYWDLFINSELGKIIYEKSGLKKTLKAFAGPDGSLSFDVMFKNFENHSFRRHWIKTAAKYLTDIVMHVAKPEVYQRYITSTQYILNSFLDTQGFPKTTHFNAKKPEKSITLLANYLLKKYMDIDTDVTEYVKPAVEYIKQTLKMAEKATKSISNRGDYNALADRLTDTLNLEIIEPVLRVYRAYKHSVANPHCQEHLMCLVNRHPDQEKKGLPGFKAGLTKLSSLAASAALSFQNGKSFWDLYNAIQNDVNCEAAYPADCSAFHEHEMKVTTEVYHSEL